MKDYNNMSDFEINKAVAELRGLELSSDHNGAYVGIVRSSAGTRPNYIHVNYCNNPSDAWQIIIENSITFNYDTAQVHVGSYFSDTAKVSENRNKALRAAMIVYLMMKDAE